LNQISYSGSNQEIPFLGKHRVASKSQNTNSEYNVPQRMIITEYWFFFHWNYHIVIKENLFLCSFILRYIPLTIKPVIFPFPLNSWSIYVYLFSLSMPLSIDPVTLILKAILPYKFSNSFLLSMDKLPLIYSIINKRHLPLSMRKTVRICLSTIEWILLHCHSLKYVELILVVRNESGLRL